MRTEDAIIESSRNLHRVYSSPKIITMFEVKVAEVGRACKTHEGQEEYTVIWWEHYTIRKIQICDYKTRGNT
jgi:hypothetical protein